jgi:hypothetical protein
MNERERVYRILPDFNSRCKKCSLSNMNAIGGHSFGSPSKIELLIVAAYPSNEEIIKGYSLAPNSVRKGIDRPNAGRYVKYSIEHIFDRDPEMPAEMKPFYNRVGFSNAIKCSPFNRRHEKLEVKPAHLTTCMRTWLEKEIAAVAKFNPRCPILLCGSEAVKLLGKNTKVYSNRRKRFIYNNTHPVIVSFNPVEVVRYTPYTITSSKTSKTGKIYVETVVPQKPIIVGSTAWHWLQDLNEVKQLVLANNTSINSNNSKTQKATYKDLLERFSRKE